MIIFFAVLSVIFDWVDFSLFLFFPDLINKIFLGRDSQTIVVAFLAWSSSYISRSLGSLFILPRLHNFRDSKTAIIFTGSLVVFPSILIAVMPSYDSIGIFSCYIFLLFRFIQGLGMGVDFPVSIFYIFDKYKSIMKTALVFSSGAFGLLLSFSCVLILKKLGLFSFFYEGNNWRILFLLISIFGVLSIIFRSIIKKETYNNFLSRDKNIFKFSKSSFIFNLFISYSYGAVFYTFFVYLPFFYKSNINKELTPIILLCSLLLTLIISFIINKKENFKSSYRTLLSGYVLTVIVCSGLILYQVHYVYQLSLLAIIIGIYASSFVYLILKKTNFYTFSVSYNLGQGTSACLTPIICSGLQSKSINIYYYLLLVTILGLLSLRYLKRSHVDLVSVNVIHSEEFVNFELNVIGNNTSSKLNLTTINKKIE